MGEERNGREKPRCINPYPHPVLGEVVEESGVKLSLGDTGRKGVFNFCLCFSLPRSTLMGNKFNFPQVESVLPVTVTGTPSPHVFISTHELSHPLFFPCPAEGKASERLGGSLALPPKAAPKRSEKDT